MNTYETSSIIFSAFLFVFLASILYLYFLFTVSCALSTVSFYLFPLQVQSRDLRLQKSRAGNMPGFSLKKILSAAWFQTASHIASREISVVLESPIISFTFDDMPAAGYEKAAGIVEQYGARATFYVAGHFIITNPEYLQNRHIQELIDRDHEIGCHTYSHLSTGSSSLRKIQEDILHNQMYFQDYFPGYRLHNFAYPYGFIGPWHKPFLAKCYESLRSTQEGINKGIVDLGALRANRIYSGKTSPEDIRRLIEQCRANKGWLVFYTHDVSAKPSHCGTTPELLESAVSAAYESQAKILTVHHALQLIRQ